MTTKDEIIAAAKTGEHVINYHTPITPHDVQKAYFIGIETGVNVAYDHRQKEIDDAYERGLAAYVDRNLDRDKAIADEANRWWASRWQASEASHWCTINCSPDEQQFVDEMDAAAARVIEVKG